MGVRILLRRVLLFDVSIESSCIEFILNMVWIDAVLNINLILNMVWIDNYVGENMGSGMYFLLSGAEIQYHQPLVQAEGTMQFLYELTENKCKAFVLYFDLNEELQIIRRFLCIRILITALCGLMRAMLQIYLNNLWF